MPQSRDERFKEVLKRASDHLLKFQGRTMDVLTIPKPHDVEAAANLAAVVSKLSPFVANMVEFEAIHEFNQLDWKGAGKWRRQDPGFPDTIFDGLGKPSPGIEVKVWFPLATEITARFRDSQAHFADENTNVAMLAWLPERVIYGRPVIIDVWVADAHSVAVARDNHYHQPPGYLVIEPRDTSARTLNLQQTNTAGYKFQGNAVQLAEAQRVVEGWKHGKKYLTDAEAQGAIHELMSRFPYRLDTNFAKMDRIAHPTLEEFKVKVMNTKVCDLTVAQWVEAIAKLDKSALRQLL